jgi:hypothetical protein
LKATVNALEDSEQSKETPEALEFLNQKKLEEAELSDSIA